MFNTNYRKMGLIMCNDYINNKKIKNLPSSLEDSKRMKNILIRLGFIDKNIHVETNCYPEKEIKKFLNICKKDDIILIYFSGHGNNLLGSIKLPQDIGLCSSWVNPDGTNLLSYYIDKLLSQILFKCKIILISDTCYSGKFIEYYKSKNNIYFIGSSSSISQASSSKINKKNKSGNIVLLFEYLLDKNTKDIIFNNILKDSENFRKNNKILYYMCLKNK